MAILMNNSGVCVFVYHNPFTEVRDGTFTEVKSPQNVSVAFPDKVANLYGLEMNLIAVNDPPHVIIKNNSVVGINIHLYEIFFKRWNATYINHICLEDRLAKCFKSIVNDLYVNNVPFFSEIMTDEFDIQPYLITDEIRLMVTNRPMRHIFQYIAWYFFNDYVFIFWGALTIAYILYIRIVGPTRCAFPFHYFVGICLRQPFPVNVQGRTQRMFFGSIFVIAFFVIMGFECQFTSQMVSYFPEKRIMTLRELESRKERIYCNPLLGVLLSTGRFNLSANMLQRLVRTTQNPWTIAPWLTKTVYLISLEKDGFFFKSALNDNLFGQNRFILVDSAVANVPILHVFPRHSPYQDDFMETYHRIYEAGLAAYWRTRTLSHNVWNVWTTHHKFKPIKYPMRDLKRLLFAFHVLAVGYIVAFSAFVLEWYWNRILMWSRTELRKFYVIFSRV